jgi:hypothetical protein
MAIEIHLGDINHIIQLAVAPVFLLTGVGTNLTVLTNRLARIIDRTRVLEERLRLDKENPDILGELRTLFNRAHFINYAITLSTTCALLICLVVALLFIGGALDLSFGKLIATFFVLAMLALIGSLSCLLREIFIATRNMSMRHVMYHPPS